MTNDPTRTPQSKIKTGSGPSPATASTRRPRRSQERSVIGRAWYRLVRQTVLQAQLVSGGIRATGREHFPTTGGVLLISNHLSYYDVFVLGVLLPRMLNYVARSTLFTPLLGPLIRSVGGFPIQRDGMGAQGLKETLKRLRGGAVVTFFPEGTRSPSGELGALKPGIATLASRAGVPVVAAGIAGTYQSWPRGRAFPRPHPIRIHYGRPITPDQLDGLSADAVLERLAQELSESVLIAKQALNRDLEVDQSMENRVAT